MCLFVRRAFFFPSLRFCWFGCSAGRSHWSLRIQRHHSGNLEYPPSLTNPLFKPCLESRIHSHGRSSTRVRRPYRCLQVASFWFFRAAHNRKLNSRPGSSPCRMQIRRTTVVFSAQKSSASVSAWTTRILAPVRRQINDLLSNQADTPMSGTPRAGPDGAALVFSSGYILAAEMT